ncbi:MAG: glycosyltransferase family 4 protein [Methanoregulaceae archaeon]|jgi:glycosyltransferase involved in cell wall biosynthesis
MKVIEIIDNFPKISETFILREILALQRKGVDIEVCAFVKPLEDIVHPEVNKVKKITYFSKTRVIKKIYSHFYWFCKKPMHYVKTATIAANRNNGITFHFLWNLPDVIFINNKKPDHIHAHWPNSSDFAMLVSLLTGTPFTFTTHHYEIFLKPPKNYRIKSKLSKKHFTVTEYNRQYIIRNFDVDEQDITVVHSALDFSKKYPIADSKGKNTLISIARLEKIKGLDVLIRACSILKSEKFVFECLIAGDGSERANLDRLIRELNLSGEVTLLGYKSMEEVFELLGKAKLLVLPSRSEGWPNVFTEAWACRVPVIGPNVRGVPDILHDGVNGFIVEPDNIEMLVEKIKILITNEPLRREFIEKGYRKAIEEFNVDYETGKLLEIWKS